MIFQNENTLFQAIKTRSSKSRNIDNFSKGLTHGFGPKTAIFPTLFFKAIQARKMFSMISQNKKRFSRQQKKEVQKVEKLTFFFKGDNPWFWSKNGHFSNFLLQPIQARKQSFMIFQNEKRLFQAIKTKSSKRRKIDIFPKLTHGFGREMAIIPTFFFRQYRLGKCLLVMVLVQKRPFFQLSFGHFSKGVNPWFWSRNRHFSKFFFQAIQARKISFIIFYNEKTPFQAIKTRSSKGRKIDIFPKRLTHGFGRKNGRFNNFFWEAIQARKISFMIFQNEKRPLQAIKTRSFRTKKRLSRL